MEKHANIICHVINHYSDGGHPMATPENVTWFQRPFVLQMLRKALDDDTLSPIGRFAAANAVDELEGRQK